MRNYHEQPIGKILNQLIDEYRLRDKLLEVRLPHAWEKLMGAAIAKRTLGISLKNGVLTIRIASAPLKNDLIFEKENIKARMNEELGGEFVQEVRVM
jgi:predicted nucleic acid-binding Zn ribbon protein